MIKNAGLSSLRSYFSVAALGAVVLALALAAAIAMRVHDGRTYALELARSGIQQQARVLGETIVRSIESVDLVVAGIADEVEARRLEGRMTNFNLRLMLKDRLLFLPQLTDIAVYGADGLLIAGARDLPGAARQVSEDAIFTMHRDRWVEFDIGSPVRGTADGKWRVPLSRRIGGPDGRFGGIVVAMLDPSFFRTLYEDDGSDKIDFVGLIDGTGTVMAAWTQRAATADSLLGEPVWTLPQFQRLRANANPAGLDHHQTAWHLTTTYQLFDYPLRLVVSGEIAVVLAHWRSDAMAMAAVAGLVVLATICFVFILGIQTSRRVAVEQALRLRERAIESSSNGTIITLGRRHDHAIIYVSPGFLATTGYAADEVIGRNPRFLHGQDRAQPGLTEIRSALKDEREVSVTVRNYRKDGSPFWAEMVISPVLDDDGETTHFVGVQRDITPRRQIEEALLQSEANYRAIYDHSLAGIAVLHSDGRLTQANPALSAILGYSQSELVGMTWKDFTHPEDVGKNTTLFQELFEGSRPDYQLEKRYIAKDGRLVWARVRVTQLVGQAGRPVSVIALVEDISDSKRAETRLLKASAELRRSNEELEQFSYSVSHDLQEPLRMVSSYLQLLQRRYQGALDKDADEFISFAVEGARRMQNMIVDLLEFSRVRRKGKQFTAADLNDALEGALANLRFAAEECHATITNDLLPVVDGDDVQLLRLFQNLIGNAIKYRAAGRDPVIHVTARRDGADWVIGVRDNGIGIAADSYDRIFQVFQRLHSATEYPGTGVGLAVARKIVERHGGRIWVESEPDAGSTFSFTLPAEGHQAADGAELEAVSS